MVLVGLLDGQVLAAILTLTSPDAAKNFATIQGLFEVTHSPPPVQGRFSHPGPLKRSTWCWKEIISQTMTCEPA
jgi:hypothetical protein